MSLKLIFIFVLRYSLAFVYGTLVFLRMLVDVILHPIGFFKRAARPIPPQVLYHCCFAVTFLLYRCCICCINVVLMLLYCCFSVALHNTSVLLHNWCCCIFVCGVTVVLLLTDVSLLHYSHSQDSTVELLLHYL